MESRTQYFYEYYEAFYLKVFFLVCLFFIYFIYNEEFYEAQRQVFLRSLFQGLERSIGQLGPDKV